MCVVIIRMKPRGREPPHPTPQVSVQTRPVSVCCLAHSTAFYQPTGSLFQTQSLTLSFHGFCNFTEHVGSHEVRPIAQHMKHQPPHRFTLPPLLFFSPSPLLLLQSNPEVSPQLEQNSPAHSDLPRQMSGISTEYTWAFLEWDFRWTCNPSTLNRTHTPAGLGPGPSLLLR